jgi:hypothetical protein
MTLKKDSRESLEIQIAEFRQEAEEARQNRNYEFAFLLYDRADKMEKSLDTSAYIPVCSTSATIPAIYAEAQASGTT